MEIADYIGTPFKSHGRSIEEGFDCYGFGIDFCREILHRTLPDFHSYEIADDKGFSENYLDVMKNIDVKKVDNKDKKYGDLILFYTNGKATHIGISLGNDTFIHCDRFGVRVLELERYGKKYEVYTWQN